MTLRSGFLPRYQGVNRMFAYVDFAAPGGMKTMSLLISPRSTASSFSLNSL